MFSSDLGTTFLFAPCCCPQRTSQWCVSIFLIQSKILSESYVINFKKFKDLDQKYLSKCTKELHGKVQYDTVLPHSNQVRVVAFSLPQLTQASFLQKNQTLQNRFLISVTLRWHRVSVACKNQSF